MVLAQWLNVNFKCQDIELVGSPVTAGTVMRAVAPQTEYLYIHQTVHSCSCVDANKEWQGIKVGLHQQNCQSLSSLVLSEAVKTSVPKISGLYDMTQCTLVRKIKKISCTFTYGYLSVKVWTKGGGRRQR